MKRRYPHTTLYHLLAAYGDVLNRAAERKQQDELFPLKLPPVSTGKRT